MSWSTVNRFRCKSMKYTNSCFPCCLSVVLKNMNLIKENTELEDAWNRMQINNKKPNLNKQAPNELDVHGNISNTAQLGGVNKMQIITPTIFDSLTNSTTDLQRLKKQINLNLPRSQYKAMIIGDAHATVVFKENNNSFVHFWPAPQVSSLFVSRDTGLIIAPAINDNKIIGILAQGATGGFSYGGSFLILIG